MAARATFALKAGVWFRRGRLFMVSPVHGDYRRCQAETPLIDLFKFAEPALLPLVSPFARIRLANCEGEMLRRGRCPPQSPAPGFGEKYWSLSGFPSHSLE